MKFVPEILSAWPTPAPEEGRLSDREAAPAKTVHAVTENGSAATLAVLQAPEFSQIPEHALVRITQIED